MLLYTLENVSVIELLCQIDFLKWTNFSQNPLQWENLKNYDYLKQTSTLSN